MDGTGTAPSRPKNGATLVADVPHFTNSQPSIQFDKIHGQALLYGIG